MVTVLTTAPLSAIHFGETLVTPRMARLTRLVTFLHHDPRKGLQNGFPAKPSR
jgi:hypothetical protein